MANQVWNETVQVDKHGWETKVVLTFWPSTVLIYGHVDALIITAKADKKKLGKRKDELNRLADGSISKESSD